LTVLDRVVKSMINMRRLGETGRVILDLIKYLRTTVDLIRRTPLSQLPDPLLTLFKKVIEIIRQCAYAWGTKNEFVWERSYYSEGKKLAKSLQMDPDEYTRKIAESFERQSRIQGSLIAEAAYLECAQSHYQTIQDKQDVDKIKQSIREKLRDAFESGEMDSLASIRPAIKEIANLKAEQIISRSGSLTLQELAHLSIWPDYNRISEEIKASMAGTPSKVPQSIKIDRLGIYQQQLKKKEDIFVYKVYMRLAFEARITELIILELFSMLLYGVIAADDFERFFRQNRFIKGEDYRAFMRIYQAYMEKDYLVVIHLSMILIEKMIFLLVKEKKVPIIRLNPYTKTAELLSFDQLLSSANSIIPPDLLAYLGARFSRLGMGFHEVITRGFLDSNDYSSSLAAACLLCVIQLVGL
ncbi:MAG: hypothetical protein ACTSW4_07155, partial [Candidatus Ranarchaeia archaeon]